LHLNLDDAWSDLPGELPVLDARKWGPRLRFSAPSQLIEEFFRDFQSRVAPFLVYGSGDFHHLTALWLRRLVEPFVLVSFDNHPDWDVRPPQWACGGWINRALELPLLEKVSVWGCGNFECWWPRQLFGNRRAERSGELEVHPWADGRPAANQNRRGAIMGANWRAKFTQFAQSLGGSNVYVTIDLDCLRTEDAVTNWESGRFSVDDVAWALGLLREKTKIVAGDICGAYSPPKYARAKQRFAAEMDHPKLSPIDAETAREINQRAFAALWPVLVGRDSVEPRATNDVPGSTASRPT
jgi:arginase family enzyme